MCYTVTSSHLWTRILSCIRMFILSFFSKSLIKVEFDAICRWAVSPGGWPAGSGVQVCGGQDQRGPLRAAALEADRANWAHLAARQLPRFQKRSVKFLFRAAEQTLPGGEMKGGAGASSSLSKCNSLVCAMHLCRTCTRKTSCVSTKLGERSRSKGFAFPVFRQPQKIGRRAKCGSQTHTRTTRQGANKY